MKATGIVLMMIAVALVAYISGFVLGRRDASGKTWVGTVGSASYAKASAPMPPKAATTYERELMSSLNAIQSGVQTGINQIRYSELIANARTKLADLRINSSSSLLLSPTEEYLNAHATVLSIWRDHYDSTRGDVVVTRELDQESYSFVRRAIPGIEHLEMNKPNHTYVAEDGLSKLWNYTENTLWTPVLAGWRTLNGG